MIPDLSSLRAIRALLSSRGIHPSRKMGQNFLVDRNILNEIVSAAELSATDHVLEVGPGLGVLTERLLEKAGRVTAVEKDRALFDLLVERWSGEPCLTLIHADALELDFAELFHNNANCLVSNLPYSVGTRVVMEAALLEKPPPRMLVLLQLEVAERIVATPGTTERGVLSVCLQQRYRTEIIRRVKAGSFWPRPDVVSALVRLKRHADHPMEPSEHRLFADLVRSAFQQRRKQLLTIFRRTAVLPPHISQRFVIACEECGISPQTRAAELEVEQWCSLARNLSGSAAHERRE